MKAMSILASSTAASTVKFIVFRMLSH